MLAERDIFVERDLNRIRVDNCSIPGYPAYSEFRDSWCMGTNRYTFEWLMYCGIPRTDHEKAITGHCPEGYKCENEVWDNGSALPGQAWCFEDPSNNGGGPSDDNGSKDGSDSNGSGPSSSEPDSFESSSSGFDNSRSDDVDPTDLESSSPRSAGSYH